MAQAEKLLLALVSQPEGMAQGPWSNPQAPSQDLWPQAAQAV